MIPVIDLFAGPGGLNEGFSSVQDRNGDRTFRAVASFEMESNAIMTLTLRAALRKLRDADGFPAPYYAFLNGEMSWESLLGVSPLADARREVGAREVFQRELGESARPEVDQLIAHRIPASGPWVLIGGPPCQAYSLAGRSRRTKDLTFSEDKKHFLFREYLHIIDRFRPTMFVMENVKGLLSSTHSGHNMFDVIKSDLACRGAYEIRSLVVPAETPEPADYVIRSERYGVPQRRHRVILLGVLKEAALAPGNLLPRGQVTTTREAIGDLPPVRSMVSPRRADSGTAWAAIRRRGQLAAGLGDEAAPVPGLGTAASPYSVTMHNGALRDWLTDPRLTHLTLHEPRSHMPEDLIRYEYLSLLKQDGQALPTVLGLPKELRPRHKNVELEGTPFLDRFKVQDYEGPSSTVTSHIAKDGHYYIHPDPAQMRSLTVREAARLQTFPDDYYFMGSRTAQYHQVGNAVPPYLAKQIGEVVARTLGVDV